FIAGLVIRSAVGGLASVAGGGKFADGAVTAAFGYLFNAGAGRTTPEKQAAAEQAFWPIMGVLAQVGLFVFGGEVLFALRAVSVGIQEIGAAGELAVGVDAVKTAIWTPGMAATRYPDILTGTTLEEVKNVANLSFTQQLQDFYLYAQQNSLTFVLWV